MLTQGKKIWGIWNGTAFLRNYVTGLIETYDDFELAQAQVQSNLSVGTGDGLDVRVISEGNQGQIETK